jgi:group I intron endonuclease
MLKNKVNGKIYIGQTIRPIHKRLAEHEKERSRCVAIYGAIQKYGWDNFEKDYYECPDEDLDFDEELLVREMGTLSPGGYNLREGGGSRGKLSEESKKKVGDGNRGKTHTVETKQKQREAHLGKTHSEEAKQKCREANIGDNHPMWGKKHRKESKKKMSDSKKGDKNHNYGKTPSDETKRKNRESQLGEKGNRYGKPHTEESKQKMSEAITGEKNHASKRVYQYDLDGIFINSFGSSEEAGRYLYKGGSSIRACARGRRNYNTAHGFKWSYSLDVFM